MFHILAIDWGSKHLGLAYGSLQTKLVIPETKLYLNDNLLFEKLQQILSQKPISEIVLGKPTNFHGGETQIGQQIESFKLELEKRFPNIKVISVDERKSSQSATAKMQGLTGKNQMIHNLSAAEILQLYLDLQNTP